jgi:hypothetical protein
MFDQVFGTLHEIPTPCQHRSLGTHTLSELARLYDMNQPLSSLTAENACAVCADDANL